MKRKILLISNPGEAGAANYCEGVHADVRNYLAFFKSPAGGYWDSNEIEQLHRPGRSYLAALVGMYKDYNYLKIIFCGHGYHCTDRNSTIIELSKDNELDHKALINAGQAQSIILDCCRVRHPGLIKEAKFEARASVFKGPMDGEACKASYNAHLSRSTGRIKIYSCGIGEKAGDNPQTGGIYSGHLIRSAIAWSERQTGADILEVPVVHELAKEATRADKPEQNAVIEKDRSGPYFPFAVTVTPKSLYRI